MDNETIAVKDKQELSEKELLEAILKENKKRTFYSRAIFAAVIVCMIMLLRILPKVDNLINNVNDTVDIAKVTLAEVENTAASLTLMSQEMEQTSEDMGTFLTENSTAISDAVTNISSIDYENLNKAIKDLKDTVEPFANFMNKFK